MKLYAVFLIVFLLIGVLAVSGCVTTPQTLSAEGVLENPDKAIATCEKMSESDKEGCYDDVISALSEAGLFDKVMEVCDKTESDDCYIDLAISAQLIDACKKISSSTMKKDCLFSLASQNNTAACKEMTNQFDRNRCLFDIAVQTGSLEVCGEIIDVSIEEECYWAIIQNLKTTDPDTALAACSKLSVNADNCYFDVIRVLCLTDVDKAVSTCGKMEYTVNKNNCYMMIVSTPEVTLANPDKAIETCGKMTMDITFCYENVAKILTETNKDKAKEACGYITDYNWRTNCEQSYG